MGSGVGTVLHRNGVRVLTCLAGRSPGSRARAEAAGFEEVPDLDTLVRSCDVLLSILPPSAAGALADQVAAAIRATGHQLLYADCNAIAPGTATEISRTILATGARFADAGIIGPPPIHPGCKIYTSGPGAAELAELAAGGLDVRVLPGEVGKASGLKMCYAAMTKGVQALGAEILVAARQLGVDDVLRTEQSEGGVAQVRAFVERSLPTMPPKAYRWIGEMEEIARTFEDAGIPGRIMLGAADAYTNVRDGGLLATDLPVSPTPR
jgi:3-hydroxyisobutyrate dehydrogenase-like beta-hydroxyacid dehydrogenase